MINYFIITTLLTMITAVPVVIIVRFVYFKITTRKVNIWHEAALILFVTFCIGLAMNTIMPIRGLEYGLSLENLNFIPFNTLIEMFGKGGDVSILNLIGNIVMFMPFGFFPAVLWNNVKFWQAVNTTFSVSLFIEIVQLFIAGRATDIDDLILNVIGGILGWYVYLILKKLFPNFLSKLLS